MTPGDFRNAFVERITGHVRGPDRLREDIADEIGDHLACHAEENEEAGLEQPWVEAERAFGDPKQIARELRRVHLGELLMFQRILAICMIVVAAGTAATVYFSWSSANDISEHMSRITESTNQQLAALAEKLDSVESGTAPPRPPELHVYCYEEGSGAPQGQYAIHLRTIDGDDFEGTFYTGRDGWLETGPLPLGVYRITGKLPIQSDECASREGYWHRIVALQQVGLSETLRIPVEYDSKYTVRVEMPPDWNWDREVMGNVLLVFGKKRDVEIYDQLEEVYIGRHQTISPFKPSPVHGLPPGDLTVWLRYPAGPDASGRMRYSGFHDAFEPIHVDTRHEEITLRFRDDPMAFTGVVRADANTPIQGGVIRASMDGSPGPWHSDLKTYRPYPLETGDLIVRTDARGRYQLPRVPGELEIVPYPDQPDGGVFNSRFQWPLFLWKSDDEWVLRLDHLCRARFVVDTEEQFEITEIKDDQLPVPEHLRISYRRSFGAGIGISDAQSSLLDPRIHHNSGTIRWRDYDESEFVLLVPRDANQFGLWPPRGNSSTGWRFDMLDNVDLTGLDDVKLYAQLKTLRLGMYLGQLPGRRTGRSSIGTSPRARDDRTVLALEPARPDTSEAMP